MKRLRRWVSMRAAVGGAVIAALCLGGAASGAPPVDARRSGFDDMTPQLQAMQRDDATNPAMLWLADGAALWQSPPAAGAPSCASCHHEAAVSMRGVAARLPSFDAALQRPLDLTARINQCRVVHQQQTPLAPESDAALALESFVAFQSRGLPIAPPDDPRLRPFRARGEALFRRRVGQLDLSCAQCHDDRAGQRLGGSTIPQAHPTGYPIYRLEWQGPGSLQRRLRGCMTGVRAEPFAYGASEFVELELYLAQRAAGLRVETPAVRP
jgi:sulfur-oxidizing protein SoxA